MKDFNVIGKSLEELRAKAVELKIENAASLEYKELQTAIKNVFKSLTPKTSTSLVYTDKNGSKFGFTKTTPKSFRFNGRLRTKKEWIKDRDVMEALISGRSNFVKPLK